MALIDTHTHLYLPEFHDDSKEAVKRAVDAGVVTMILPNVDHTTIAPMKELYQSDPVHLRMAMGLHPTSVEQNWEESILAIESELNQERYVAVGEIGVDLYWDKKLRDEQMQAFERQIKIAVDKCLPIIIHCRDALSETLEVMESFKNLRGVFHSFGGSADDVDSIRKRVGDFYFGINGIVSFKNSGLRNVLPSIGLDRILLETDSPYLSPVPMRGKRCESAYIVHTANHIALSLDKEISEVETVTTQSAKNLFSL